MIIVTGLFRAPAEPGRGRTGKGEQLRGVRRGGDDQRSEPSTARSDPGPASSPVLVLLVTWLLSGPLDRLQQPLHLGVDIVQHQPTHPRRID